MGSGKGRKVLFDAKTFASRMRRFRTNTSDVVWCVDRGGSKEMKHFFDSYLHLRAKVQIRLGIGTIFTRMKNCYRRCSRLGCSQSVLERA